MYLSYLKFISPLLLIVLIDTCATKQLIIHSFLLTVKIYLVEVAYYSLLLFTISFAI